MMSEDRKLNRRSLLKGTAATTGSFVAGLGSASAASGTDAYSISRHPIERQYLESQALKAAVRAHAADLLAELEDRGLLSSSLDDLPFDNLREDETHIRPTDTERKVGVVSVEEDGLRTAHIMLSENTSTHQIAIYVQPEAGESYAHVAPRDDGLAEFSINTGRVNTKATTSITCDDFYTCDWGNVCHGDCNVNGINCADYVYYYSKHYTQYKCGSTFEDCCSEFEGYECLQKDDCYCSGCCEGCEE